MRIRNNNVFVLLLALLLGVLVAFYSRIGPAGYIGEVYWAQSYSQHASFKEAVFMPP